MFFSQPEQIISQLKWRYAVKRFDPDKKIPSDLWKTLEQSLILTPSSYGLQPWRFVVVQNRELRKQLRAVSWNQSQVEDCSHFVVFSTLKEMTEQYIDRYMKAIAQTRSIPVESLEGFKKAVFQDVVVGPRSKWAKEWLARQAYIALGNFMTSAAALQVDTCPMEGLDPVKYDQILGLDTSPYQTIVCCAAGYHHPEDAFSKLTKVRFTASDLIEYR